MIPSIVHAANRFSLSNFGPVLDAGTMFSIQESETLNKYQWSLGTTIDYSYRPLKATINNTDIDLIKRSATEYFYGTIGLTNWFSLSANLPVTWYERFGNPDTPNAAAINKGALLGDVELETKFKLIDRDKYPIGFAIVPFMTIPSGEENYFAGDEGVTGGGKLVLDSNLTERTAVSINIGGRAREHYNAYGLDFGHQLSIGTGLSFKAADFLSVVGEAETRTPFSDLFGDKDTSPTEVRGGLQWRFGENNMFAMNTGVAFGIINGSCMPQYRGFISLNATNNFKKKINDHHHKTKKFKENNFAQLQELTKAPKLFAFDSEELEKETLENLNQIAEVIVNGSNIKQITIEGHTDSTGNVQYNKHLGFRRAQAAMKYLLQKGIAAEKISIVSFGEEKPVASNNTSDGRQKNRRVEIKFQTS